MIDGRKSISPGEAPSGPCWNIRSFEPNSCLHLFKHQRLLLYSNSWRALRFPLLHRAYRGTTRDGRVYARWARRNQQGCARPRLCLAACCADRSDSNLISSVCTLDVIKHTGKCFQLHKKASKGIRFSRLLLLKSIPGVRGREAAQLMSPVCTPASYPPTARPTPMAATAATAANDSNCNCNAHPRNKAAPLGG